MARQQRPGRSGWKCSGLAAGLALALAGSAEAQVLEIRHGVIGQNLQWPLGGRPPLDPPATTNQFASILSEGGAVAPLQPTQNQEVNVTRLNPAQSLAANALLIGLPAGRDAAGQVRLILLAAALGRPYLGQAISFFFGEEIPPPSVDERGQPLPPLVPPRNYWRPEPFSTNQHTGAGYYWSPHTDSADPTAGRVFANRPGQVVITWRRSAPTNAQPPGLEGQDWVREGAVYYPLYTRQYLVSSAPAKPPRTIYWTEGVFRRVGLPVDVPGGRVGDIRIAYSDAFPERVPLDQVYRPPGQVPITDPADTNRQALEETRTLWFDRPLGQIFAYNREGRVLLEILGDRNPDGQTRRRLGVEIVDVRQQPDPLDIRIELGERLRAYPPEEDRDDAALWPMPIENVSGQRFFYRQVPEGTDRPVLWATRETLNLNDVLVHWLEEGIAGLRWPFRFVRYTLRWPADVTRYSQYLRPPAATEVEAQATAVPLPLQNAPVIEYQDFPDQPRAKFTDDFRFYTWLTPAMPVHRTLIRFTSGSEVAFERVLSWLSSSLDDPRSLAGTFVSDLTVPGADGSPARLWDPERQQLNLPEHGDPKLRAPRVVRAVVPVGQRLQPPPGEIGAEPGADYLAGYVQHRGTKGALFSISAYVDPFARGFEEAARGSILPVNALPDNDRLEVWWFRRNRADPSRGFQPVYWPSVVGFYTVTWPADARQIILAGNDGSGPLSSLEARGRLYVQNDRSRPGFNPNEEHALILGGQVYALRDDLNLTNPSDPDRFSSRPFVLLEYLAADGRPAMTVFEVVRERPDLGITFDYRITAGTILQPPMPLPLMEKPMVVLAAGQPPVSLNREVLGQRVTGGQRNGAGDTLTLADPPLFRAGRALWIQNDSAVGVPTYRFFPVEVAPEANTLRGIVSEELPLELENLTPSQPGGSLWRWVLPEEGEAQFAVHDPVAIIAFDEEGGMALALATVSDLNRVERWIELSFGNPPPDSVTGAAHWALWKRASVDPAEMTGWRLAVEPLPAGVQDPSLREFYAAFTLQDRKGNVWVYRGPHDPNDQAELQMQFYYKTLPGFYFPDRPLTNQPAVGTFTPYLRSKTTAGDYVGDAVHADQDGNGVADGQALPIRYLPVWPETAPVLFRAETLTLPKRGLPAVRGQTSLRVVYQQSQISDQSQVSVVLHDPTREKSYALAPEGDGTRLDALPDSIQKQSYRGKIYFPQLPPHLVERFFYDPNRGVNGALVLRGEFVDAPVGDDYLLLNVLGPRDQQELANLCSPEDPRRAKWLAALAGLSTALEWFVENPSRPGTYIPDPSRTLQVGPDALTPVAHEDQAVDSYALTAIGPGQGYITLIAGNGRAFTPAEEPVSLLILRVSGELYRGEVKVLTGSNPLSEKVTLQQVIDLAGRTDAYEFEWRIAAPVDGFPPPVYETTRSLLLEDAAWNHIPFVGTQDPLHSLPREGSGPLTPAGAVVPIQRLSFSEVSLVDGAYRFHLASPPTSAIPRGTRVQIRDVQGRTVLGLVQATNNGGILLIQPDPGQPVLRPDDIRELAEAPDTNRMQSLVFRTFTLPSENSFRTVWLSLDLDPALGAEVYLNGQRVVMANRGSLDTPTTTGPPDLVPLPRLYRLGPEVLGGGRTLPSGERQHTVAVALFSTALPDTVQTFNLRLEAHRARDLTQEPATPWLPLEPAKYLDGIRAILGGEADVRSLADNYLIMRYRPRPTGAAWSQWTEPRLAEGWIKRVLAGINPFNQRIRDFFQNRVSTDVSLVAQAGPRWEGDVALNLENLQSAGLIEIYETVLRRGKMLSIGAGINYGPANDALLLAAGYLNDLYMILGNEARADAANPTIGIGTKDRTYGEVATALFAFKGQVASLLEEELALLRGRDDFLQPGVELRPVYNRLFWNYTRGIDAGEVVYALNYNIQEQQDTGVDGFIDADDARRMFPQGHGDAYGHYLTALKGYYSLLMDTDFDWVPRIEAVNVLGVPVSVDYQDERKFAAAAAAVARTGKQIFDLTWRQDYQPGRGRGWSHFAPTRTNTRRALPVTRYWGMDHWAARTGQGAYLHWVVGNAILPDVDPDPTHEGIQKVDRTTVPELQELVATAADLQRAMDNAEAGLSPLGLPQDAIAFDINPNLVTGANPQTHFEQIYERALGALRNALAAFDDAKDITRLMRSEQDSLAEFQTQVGKQELAYQNALIELYGTPYPDDIGPGRTYPSGYDGPDLIHFMYVDNVELTFPGLLEPRNAVTYQLDFQPYPPNWMTDLLDGLTNIVHQDDHATHVQDPGDYTEGVHYVSFTLGPHGFFAKPAHWTGRRAAPGRLQQAISDIIKARNRLHAALNDADGAKDDLDKAIQMFGYWNEKVAQKRELERSLLAARQSLMAVQAVNEMYGKISEVVKEEVDQSLAVAVAFLPDSLIVGVAAGGDLTAPAEGAVKTAGKIAKSVLRAIEISRFVTVKALELAVETSEMWVRFEQMDPIDLDLERKEKAIALGDLLWKTQIQLFTINQRIQELDDAWRQYQALLAQGERIQAEREIFRRRAAAVIQGFRTRDAAFRIFRNEKLERYQTLFDLAARYTLLAANAYDYETGLLDTPRGRELVRRIIAARALGVTRDGLPQFAGSHLGDPGLSSVLAEMKADWDVLKGRLGFNNPDAYGTTVSLRTEHLRLLPGRDGDTAWQDFLRRTRVPDILSDPDVRRHCLMAPSGSDLPVPGLIIPFSTTITEGLNLFGRPLAAGDHAFSPASFATKIYAVGVALEGYRGMDNPSAHSGTVTASGATSPSDPSAWFLDPLALAATPYVYLIPVGLDTMRAPPLLDTPVVRTWQVEDVTVPLPFNIGGATDAMVNLWHSADWLTEPLFGLRRHQPFRPVATATVFNPNLFGVGGSLMPSAYTNRRLIGRSVWNTQWKLVIPGNTLLNDPNEGLDRFIRTVQDIRLHFITYSYSGN